MLNKKILAAAIAVAFSSGASAVVDLNADDPGTLTVATESFDSSDFVDDLLPITDTGGTNALDIQTEVGFSVAAGESRFARFDLTGAEFGDTPVLTAVDSGGVAITGFASTISEIEDSFVVFEFNATGAIDLDSVLTLTTSQYNAEADTDVDVQYRLYETGAGARNEVSSLLLQEEEATFLQFDSALDAGFAESETVVATVSSGFTEFDVSTTEPGNASGSEFIAQLGSFDVNELIASDTIDTDSVAFEIDDLIDVAGTFVITGDFSVGTFSVVEVSCAAAGAAATSFVIDEDEATVTSANDLDTAVLALCLNVTSVAGDEDQIQRSEYTITIESLAGDDISDDIGEVVYDTTSIEVPFVTTFSDYNQRIYIINTSSSEALYTVNFVSEDGITYTAGDAANGTAAADEVTLILASDLVDISGGSRIAAFIEIELADEDVAAATQIVNRSSGETDTIILN